MRRNGRTCDAHQAFHWTAERLQQLKDSYAACTPMPLSVAAHTIATALEWPELSVKTKLMQLYPSASAPTLPTSLPQQQLTNFPYAEAGPFLWDVQIATWGRQRWALRYRYSEWPWGAGQIVTYQHRLYRVQRIGCASLVVALLPVLKETHP